MYLRPHRRVKNGTLYEYWSLVKSVRTARGPRQETVAFIGKEPGLERSTRVGREQIGAILDGKPREPDLFDEAGQDVPAWATVDVSRVSVERLRQFGNVYLGLALWRRLGLAEFFEGQVTAGCTAPHRRRHPRAPTRRQPPRTRPRLTLGSVAFAPSEPT